MMIRPFSGTRTGRRPGIPALVAVSLLVSLLALPAAAAAGAGHAHLLPPALTQAQRR